MFGVLNSRGSGRSGGQRGEPTSGLYVSIDVVREEIVDVADALTDENVIANGAHAPRFRERAGETGGGEGGEEPRTGDVVVGSFGVVGSSGGEGIGDEGVVDPRENRVRCGVEKGGDERGAGADRRARHAFGAGGIQDDGDDFGASGGEKFIDASGVGDPGRGSL